MPAPARRRCAPRSPPRSPGRRRCRRNMRTASTSRPQEVDAELARYAEGADKPHYLVSEIFLPVDNPDQDAKVLKTAQSVEEQLKSGRALSPMVARQFSQSPSAASGGDMGWVHDGQLGARTEHRAAQDGGQRRLAAHSLHRRLLHSGAARAPGAAGHQDRQIRPRSRSRPTAPCRWRACCCRWAPRPPRKWSNRR